MALRDELEIARKDIKTDSYPISIRELASLYREGELDIHPEFQRFLRWSTEQKTTLVESLLLGIPIPSIFVFQRTDGVLDVVDGLQRISTILHFMGELKDEDNKLLPPLIMSKAAYLPSLEGKQWASNDQGKAVGEDIQKFFRQEKIDIKILLRESDDQAKYELFQRINTGGTPLSDQEVRNCILIMINRDAFFEIENLSRYEQFVICSPIPERLSLERYDIELVLRFLLLKDTNPKDITDSFDLSQFLTTEMRESFAPGARDFQADYSLFRRVFAVLDQACGDNALRKYDARKKRFGGPFLISAFELIALGVAANIDFVESKDAAWLAEKIEAIWSDPRAEGIYGQGVSTARRLPKTLSVGRAFFSED
ncbi:DUF262 domain-containing protein [Methylocystis rosea]|uniref:DUF262 domain-containing protein n=1 Tax=Methylocystis rosea TaxID=173366 RepID=A0ABX6EM83_9HYPH|nr:DUF262 domain-containing protein [Methylocystis rosea]QGM94546.1 DUF262 domain-containing protein [Methylocystis rosea]